MIDEHTGEGICVIDLDTVMPGSALYDFGDLVRTGAVTGAEDERDLSASGWTWSCLSTWRTVSWTPRATS